MAFGVLVLVLVAGVVLPVVCSCILSLGCGVAWAVHQRKKNLGFWPRLIGLVWLGGSSGLAFSLLSAGFGFQCFHSVCVVGLVSLEVALWAIG